MSLNLRPRISSARRNKSAAAGNSPARSFPIPTTWAPCPANKSAAFEQRGLRAGSGEIDELGNSAARKSDSRDLLRAFPNLVASDGAWSDGARSRRDDGVSLFVHATRKNIRLERASQRGALHHFLHPRRRTDSRSPRKIHTDVAGIPRSIRPRSGRDG